MEPNTTEQSASSYLQRLSSRKNVIVLDTETTGLDPSHDELLQVSIINAHGETLYNSYIRPTNATNWPEAERINNISPAMVTNAPTIAEALPEIQHIIQDADCIIGYNTCFDIDFLRWANCDFPDWCGNDPVCLIIDVMELFSAIYGEWNPYYGNYKWQSLVRAAEYYEYHWDNAVAHNSLGDCFATLHVWSQMVAREDVERAERLIRTALAQGYPEGY